MTKDEFFSTDILKRLQMASHAIAGPNNDGLGVPPSDPVVWSEDDIVIHVSDVLRDAIVAIRRLRGELPPKDGPVTAHLRLAGYKWRRLDMLSAIAVLKNSGIPLSEAKAMIDDLIATSPARPVVSVTVPHIDDDKAFIFEMANAGVTASLE